MPLGEAHDGRDRFRLLLMMRPRALSAQCFGRRGRHIAAIAAVLDRVGDPLRPSYRRLHRLAVIQRPPVSSVLIASASAQYVRRFAASERHSKLLLAVKTYRLHGGARQASVRQRSSPFLLPRSSNNLCTQCESLAR